MGGGGSRRLREKREKTVINVLARLIYNYHNTRRCRRGLSCSRPVSSSSLGPYALRLVSSCTTRSRCVTRLISVVFTVYSQTNNFSSRNAQRGERLLDSKIRTRVCVYGEDNDYDFAVYRSAKKRFRASRVGSSSPPGPRRSVDRSSRYNTVINNITLPIRHCGRRKRGPRDTHSRTNARRTL